MAQKADDKLVKVVFLTDGTHAGEPVKKDDEIHVTPDVKQTLAEHGFIKKDET